MSLRRTALYDVHKSLGGKIIPFAGWELPVQYSGIIAEHEAVRTRAGIFDVSHMGEILVSGPEAEAALQYMTCNDVSVLYDGKGQYNAIINDQGGVVDDIIVYRYNSERFFICVNASNTDKDFAWFNAHNTFDAHFENLSSSYGQIAIQGPRAFEIVSALSGGEKISDLKYFHFRDVELVGIRTIAARTGYTGEDGFELFVEWNRTPDLWHALLESGSPLGLVPCGLGARDSLRLEACYPLHGHELSDDTSALESGLGWIVKLTKGDFIGRAVLEEEKRRGSKSGLAGFVVIEPGIARQGDKVYSKQGQQIGVVTSGTRTPTVKSALGLALVSREFVAEGTSIAVEVRDKKLAATVVKKPFYKRPTV